MTESQRALETVFGSSSRTHLNGPLNWGNLTYRCGQTKKQSCFLDWERTTVQLTSSFIGLGSNLAVMDTRFIHSQLVKTVQ